MNILLLYHSSQTYTNTVFEHVNAFATHSSHRYFFCHHDQSQAFDIDLSRFDAVVIHYCLRLPYDQISEQAAQRLAAFGGLKALFIQDEYEHTHRAWHWIRRLGIQLVFTVVPEANIARVYPPSEFPGVRFVSNLTGYVSQEEAAVAQVPPPSTRPLLVGYRGRPLPLRYGQLGHEKVEVGRLVKAYCQRNGLAHDIAWSEESRIYGPAWPIFVGSCRSMLGSESGSNVFDWDGTLSAELEAYKQQHPGAREQELYEAVVAGHEMPGLMNQVSPRVFEAISLRTVLVLFEGTYSGVVEPGRHYIPLRKDGGNLDEVFRLLQDGAFVDRMAEQAWSDVVASGAYSFARFVQWTDGEMSAAAADLAARAAAPVRDFGHRTPTPVTAQPVRWIIEDPPPVIVVMPQPASFGERLRAFAVAGWALLPDGAKVFLRPLGRGLLRPAMRLARRTLHALRS